MKLKWLRIWFGEHFGYAFEIVLDESVITIEELPDVFRFTYKNGSLGFVSKLRAVRWEYSELKE